MQTGPPFYKVIRTTRWSTRLQGKGSIFISQLFYTLSVVPVREIEPTPSRSAVKRSTDWAINPATVGRVNLLHKFQFDFIVLDPYFISFLSNPK